PAQPNDPKAQIQDGVAAAVNARLSPDQADQYKAELGQRADNQKRVAVRNLVAQLDRDLVLSEGQRERLCEALASHWDANWCRQLETFQYGGQVHPNIPDSVIAPLLTGPQKDVWRSMPKNNNVFFGAGFLGNVMLDADPLGIEPPDEGPGVQALPRPVPPVQVFQKTQVIQKAFPKREAVPAK